MSEFVNQYQCFIKSKDAKSVGKTGMIEKTNDLMKDFLDDICKTVLNADDEVFLIQWAISKLNAKEAEEVKDAAEKGWRMI